MFPVLAEIGRLPLRSYGLAMAIAFLAAIWLARRRARKSGLNPDLIIDLAFFVIVASIAGARATYVAVHWDYFRLYPGAIPRVWDGGLAQYGGIAAGVAVGLLFLKGRKVPLWKTADVVTPSLALGVAIGRIGCFLNGCCFGRPCELPWGVVFPPESAAGHQFRGIALHPTQLYESLAALGVLGVLLLAERRKPFDGFLLWLFIILLSAYRFAVDHLRYYEPMSVVSAEGGLTLTSNQIIGLAFVVVSAACMVCLRRRSSRDRTPGDSRRR